MIMWWALAVIIVIGLVYAVAVMLEFYWFEKEQEELEEAMRFMGPDENTCVMCGRPIPEGRMVCEECEKKVDDY